MFGLRHGLVVRWRRFCAALWRRRRGILTTAVDLVAALLLCLLVAALGGAIAMVVAFLYGAADGGLRFWFAAGFLFALLGIAILFWWDRRS